MGYISNWTLVFKRLRQSKVQDLDLALGSDLHIGGFQVSVNDALLMSRFDSLSDLTADFLRFLNRHWPFGNTLLQGLAWDQLQHQEVNVICVLEAVNGCNVGVIQ